MTIFGKDKIVEVAAVYKKKLITSETCPGVPLETVCSKLSRRVGLADPNVEDLVTAEVMDLLENLLKLSADERISASKALEHPAFLLLMENNDND